MFIYPEKRRSRKDPAETGSPPYYHQSDCLICRKQDGQGHEETPPPGGYIVEGKHFLVEHAPLKLSNAGTVIVESRRYLLDFGEMTSAESAELGSILKRLVPALKIITGAHRIYFLALMERVSHFHLWLVPKKKQGPLRGVAYPARLPVPASSSAAEAISRKLRRRFERSRGRSVAKSEYQ
jgi:diadenosine tetraphosphate (Ap4A) HIT family hydrolase